VAAKYKVASKIDSGNNTLLILTIVQESQLVLDKTRLGVLDAAVKAATDQPNASSLGREMWLSFIDDITSLRTRLSDTPILSKINLEAPWSELPDVFLVDILAQFESTADAKLRIFLQGEYPSVSVVFNIGRVSFPINVSVSQGPQIQDELNLIVKTCIDSKNAGESDDATRKTVEALVDTARVTTEIGKCAIAAGTKDWIKAAAACGAAVASVQALADKYAKAQAEKDELSQREAKVHDCDAEDPPRTLGDRVTGFAEPMK
jgi:hypothetical protein